ncbi:MAG TPA: hypothetical protein EYG73_00475 [Arcobacter sp.]|nr:hypothetical protein [Arcobacter sp.]
MKFVRILLLLAMFCSEAFSDVSDSVNLSYEKVKIKQKSEKNNNDKCYMYVYINGNDDWDEKKDELNTIIDNSNHCNKITIYKSINNVNTSSGNSNDDEFDVNIGTIIKKNGHIDIETITVVNNTNIKSGYFSSTANVGNVIKTGRNSNIKMNNVKMINRTEIKNSNLGSAPLVEMGMGLTVSELSNIGK